MLAMQDPIGFLRASGAQAFADATMVDTCVRLAYSGNTNADGRKIKASHDDAETYPCAFSWGSAGDTDRTQESADEIVTTTPRLCVPLNAIFTSRDQVRLTHRDGQALAEPLTFQVAGTPLPGLTCITLELKRVGT